MGIHPTALVDVRAELAEDVIIHPYTIIGPEVVIEAGCSVGPHVVIEGQTHIGRHNQICPFVTIGFPPQDITYGGEPTQVLIGDHNIFREHVTIHRGTPRGGGVTRIGNHNFIMAYAHIAHDCKLGDQVIMANGATLGGHVQVDDYAVIGGLAAIHQYVRIGAHAYIGGLSGVSQDIPPYTLIASEHASIRGLNLVGLKRNDFSPEAIQALKNCYRILFRSKLTVNSAIEKVRQDVASLPEVETLLDFMGYASKRGIIRRVNHQA
jgi:UDP-N-acetylglucosamine acyltransferase